MHDLKRFTMKDMTECGIAIRQIAKESQSLAEVADKVVRFFHENLLDHESGAKNCALVRLFKTQLYSTLSPELKEFAQARLGGEVPGPDLRCLVLLATAGEKPEWNSITQSAGHRAIPLSSVQMVEQAPMISNLIQQLGLEVATVIKPDPKVLMDADQKTYNVFYVPVALGSPYLPAQESFVKKRGIQSALGMGGLLPWGDLFSLILFTRTPIPQETADLFKTLALSTKLAILPFAKSHDGVTS
jgi:two-component system NtrC family sensor kinase